MTDFYLTIDHQDGNPKDVEGPFKTHNEAWKKGLNLRDGKAKIEVHTSTIICDFCSGPLVLWRYPARDFAVEEVEWGSSGDWAACQECHELIERGNKEGLVERSAKMFIKRRPEEIPKDIPEEIAIEALKQGIRELHTMFYVMRSGPAQMELTKN